MIGRPRQVAVTLVVDSQGYRSTVSRRRGGIEPLRVSTPHELKSCPSTSPTHPGPPAQKGGGAGSARSWAPAGQLALYRKSRARDGGCADASMDASQLRLSFSRGARGSRPLAARKNGLLRELNPGPLAPEARIMPLDQAAVLENSPGYRTPCSQTSRSLDGFLGE